MAWEEVAARDWTLKSPWVSQVCDSGPRTSQHQQKEVELHISGEGAPLEEKLPLVELALVWVPRFVEFSLLVGGRVAVLVPFLTLHFEGFLLSCVMAAAGEEEAFFHSLSHSEEVMQRAIAAV